MKNGERHFMDQLNEVELLLQESRELDYTRNMFNRIVGIIKRQPKLLSSTVLSDKLLSIGDKIFNKTYGPPYSLVKGTLMVSLLLVIGFGVNFLSNTFGILALVITTQSNLITFIDSTVLGLFSQYIILAGGYLLSRLPIGYFCGISYDGYYIRKYGQPAQKKNVISFIKAGKKRILFYFLLFCSSFLWLLSSAILMFFLSGNFYGFIVVLLHLIITLYLGFFHRKSDFYRFLREIRTIREIKALSSIFVTENSEKKIIS